MIRVFRVFCISFVCAIALLSGCKTKKISVEVRPEETVSSTKVDELKYELDTFLPEEAVIEMVNNSEAIKLTFNASLLFVANSNTLNDASKNTLRKLAESLNSNPETNIQITGYSDNTGNIGYNQTLSERRAKSVFDFLIDIGISSSRMEYSGKGIHDPIADNNTVEGRATNRRIEILIVFAHS
jgi:outer membrane protein OmpA-like peptidoglycan-associated protein